MSQKFAVEIEFLIARLQPIRSEVLQAEQHFREELDRVYLGNLQSARNLVHYVSLRRHDIRDLQEDLGRLALSSLGRLESHVIATLDALLALLHKIAGRDWPERAIEETFAEFDSGSALLEKHTVESLGEAPGDRNVRIMVTMPSEAASDPNLVRDFLDRGMNIMRINCAHDSAEEWLRIVENLQAAQEETGKACKITFDLAGPKLRTGPLSPGPGIIRWKPVRNELGQVTTPAYVAFCTDEYASDDETIAIPVKGSIFRHARAGDVIELTDTRGRERILFVVEVDPSCCVCTNDRTGYVIEGTRLRLLRENELLCEDEVGALPEVEQALSLSVGDDLLVTSAEVPGKPAEDDEDEVVYQPAQIGCSLPAIFTDAQVGERIFFDDGKIEGVIRAVHTGGSEPRLEVKITHAANGTAKLRAEKGINLPDTKLNISALTPKDREDLEFATQYGDLVSLSFVRRPEDVAELIGEVDRLFPSQFCYAQLAHERENMRSRSAPRWNERECARAGRSVSKNEMIHESDTVI